jgi:hypothetical protein
MGGSLKFMLAGVLLGALSSAGGQPVLNPGSASIAKFRKNISDYMSLRKAALKDLPDMKLSKSAGKADDLQSRFAERIVAARAGARQGDICTSEIAAELKRLLAQTMQGADAVRIRKSLRNAEPTQLPVAVNGQFPDKLPLQSTPASLLLNLPRLPTEIEYRLVGRTLVLRDSEANVIIDFVREALPPPR